MRVKTVNGATFPSPIGLGSGLLIEGRGIDSIISSSGVDSASGLSTFVEIGTCTPERQSFRKGEVYAKVKIDLEKEVVTRVNSKLTPGVSEVVASLLERQ